ncbi:MAG: alpha/beta hydrolase [Kiritimatiellales bacterium]|nr:alpha/beta hydrolase [Kiritimatiellales bacterium]
MRIILFITAIAVLTVSGSAVAQLQVKTSENTPQFKKFLERRPDADLNKDGILTMEEVREWKLKQKEIPGKKKNQPQRTPPTHADVKYGDHEAMALDFWQAESKSPTPLFVFIHGGGFRGGDKKSVPAVFLKEFLGSGVSVATINYRLSGVGPYPLQMNDSARAIQFLRSKAKEWNIDPARLAAGGGSAGSGISQWLAFHEDMADPKSNDPISRQSTRLTCALPINMQSTYDPREIKKIIPGDAYKHPALPPFFGCTEGWDWDSDKIDAKLDALIKDASPINHLSKDDPPVFLIHNEKSNTSGNIHHSNFGKHLKEAMDNLGIECLRRMDSDYASMDEAYEDMARFVKKHFGIK